MFGLCIKKNRRIKKDLDKTIDYLKQEFASLQASRATPSLLDGIEVSCYNQVFPLNQLASIQVSEARTILIKPWDAGIIKQIEDAIRQSNLDLSPVVDGEVIRLTLPSLTEEKRKELVKIVQEKAEEARISIRRQREELWQEIQDMEKNKEISEDDKFKAKDRLQKNIDEYNKKVEEMRKRKEEDLMQI